MSQLSKKNALVFVILMGMVSLFADMTYEGGRSITGQYLALLGATGTVVGFVAGFGELIGYTFRLAFGYLSDKTGRYWLFTIVGYIINLLAIPLLALVDQWPLAAGLIVLERFGKAIRTPSKDAMLSYATHQLGRGWGFGLHEAMDQIGALAGPLMIAGILWYKASYQWSFGLLLIPALCSLAFLINARRLYPRPQELEVKNGTIKAKGFTKDYWLYIAAISCVAAGYVDFPLMAYHFKTESIFKDVWIPLIFALAMASDGLSALIFGKLYDKKGLHILVIATALAAFFAPLVFLTHPLLVIVGAILWGIGLGAQESVMRAVVADLVPMDKRGTGYGMLNLWFGIFWFLGSALMGYLYDVSIPALIIFSFAAQVSSIPLFLAIHKSKKY
jgi:MFS family permease